MEVDRKRYPYEAKANDPGETLYYSDLMVMESGAGYYIGREGFCCVRYGKLIDGFSEPYSRESEYYRTHEEAQKALESAKFSRESGIENEYARSVGNLPSKE